jgi:SAM-dependent methyltransferase
MHFEHIYQWISLNLRYFNKPPWDTDRSPVELLDFIQSHPPGKYLDLGCGTGTNCLTLAKAGWQVTGVDLARRAIWLARRKFNADHQEGVFFSGDLLKTKLPPDEFDLVLDMGCYHSLAAGSRSEYQTAIYCWLKPDGVFLIYGHRYSENHLFTTSLTDLDIDRFQENLILLKRKDSQDMRGREVVWLWFRKPGK